MATESINIAIFYMPQFLGSWILEPGDLTFSLSSNSYQQFLLKRITTFASGAEDHNYFRMILQEKYEIIQFFSVV